MQKNEWRYKNNSETDWIISEIQKHGKRNPPMKRHRRLYHNNTSGIRGISQDRNRWDAKVTINGVVYRKKKFKWGTNDEKHITLEMAKKWLFDIIAKTDK